jgi:sec-independent protein translocase protein TatC
MTPPPQDEIHDPTMPLMQHLEELRKRVLISAGAIFGAFCVCWTFSEEVMAFIEAPVLKHVGKLQFDTITDPFFTHTRAAFYAALFLTFPFVLTQMWLFIRPALYKKEKHVVWPFLVFSFPLFVGGGLFCYMLVFPFAFGYLINFDPTLAPSLRIGDYLTFVIRMLFIFGLVFELPLVSLLLTRFGLLTPGFLNRNRRYAIVIIFIAAAVLTPTPDVFNQLLLAVPLLVLYEISLLVSWLAVRRSRKPEGSSG